MTISRGLVLTLALIVLGVFLVDQAAWVLQAPRGLAVAICGLWGLGVGFFVAQCLGDDS
jgi:hypothetical protein